MVNNNSASPNLENFKSLSSSYNYIPVFIKINKGHFSPVSVYKNLENKSNSFLLESVEGNILSKITNLIYLLDYSTIYSAVLSNTNPTSVDAIDYIKSKLE